MMPLQGQRQRGGEMYGLSEEQRKIYQQAWMESLAALFGLIVSVDEELESKRLQLQLKGDRLFDSMDVHRLGYLSLNVFANWVADNCGYLIKNEDLLGLQRSLDKNSDYRISRDEFIGSVTPPVDPEEEGDAED